MSAIYRLFDFLQSVAFKKDQFDKAKKIRQGLVFSNFFSLMTAVFSLILEQPAEVNAMEEARF